MITMIENCTLIIVLIGEYRFDQQQTRVMLFFSKFTFHQSIVMDFRAKKEQTRNVRIYILTNHHLDYSLNQHEQIIGNNLIFIIFTFSLVLFDIHDFFLTIQQPTPFYSC